MCEKRTTGDAPDTLPDDTLLREALRALPVSPPSADLDARILAALHAPRPWWEALWQAVRREARPLLAGAVCALPVTMLALLWTLHAPLDARPAAGFLPSAPARAQNMASLDALLDKPNITAADLRRWEQGGAVTAAPPPRLPPLPRRRACLPWSRALAA